MKRMGRYQLTSTLHQRDGVIIYLAYDPIFECEVVIKAIKLNGLPHGENRFYQQVEAEARMIMSLEHPAIVPLHNIHLEQDQLYFVMPYLSGGTLAERIQEKPLSFRQAIQLMGQLTPALELAHAKGILHRNLKPTNILFDEQAQPYLSDFACPTLQCYLNVSDLSSSAYSSPELACHTKTIDQRSDVYGLGVMLFEMLTGTLPYQADQPLGVAYKHLYNPIPTASTFQADLPSDCDQIIKQAMAKAPSARYSTVSELNDALNAIITNQQASKFYPSIPSISASQPLLSQKHPEIENEQAIQSATSRLDEPKTDKNNGNNLKHSLAPSHKPKRLFTILRTWPGLATLSLLFAILVLLLFNMEYILGIIARSYWP